MSTTASDQRLISADEGLLESLKLDNDEDDQIEDHRSDIVVQLQPIPPTHRPPPPTPLPGSRFQIVFLFVFESILSRDSKMTGKRLKIDSSGVGSVVGFDESGG